MHRTRAWRRAQRDRKIQKVFDWMNERQWYIWNNSTDDVRRRALLMETAKLRHSSPKNCSNWCCGNPRAHFGAPTMAERRFGFHCVEEYVDLGIRVDFTPDRKKSW